MPPFNLRKRRSHPGEPEKFLSKIVWHFHRKRKKMVRRSVNLWLAPFVSAADFNHSKRIFLKCFGNDVKNFQLVSHAEISTESLTVAPASSSIVEPPCAPGASPRRIETIFPAIRVHVLNSAVAAADSTAIMADGRIGVPDFYTEHPHAIISEPKHLLWHGRDGRGLVARSEVMSRDSGIMLFAHGSANWYHWLIENLPIAFLTEGLNDGLNDLPLVIPAEISGMASFQDSLELFRNGRDVVPLGPGLHHFKQLLIVDSPVREPMNLRPGSWPDVADYSINLDVMRQYRAAILDRLGISAPSHSKRIFLARGNSRRLYNQTELVAIAERHGFSVVFPELLSFRSQIELLASAAFVVGPSGAAFTNTLFCQTGTRLLSWLPPQYGNFCSYTNLASVTESRLRFLFTTPDKPLRSTLDAFRAGYNVGSDAFEAALRLALESPEY